MSTGDHAMDKKTPVSLVAEIELMNRVDVEVVRLELQRLAKRYGAEVKAVRLERRLD